MGQEAAERIRGITPINHLPQRGGDTPMGEEVAEGTKGWRAWADSRSQTVKAPGQSREEVRGDPKLRQNENEGTAEARRGWRS